MSHWIEELRVTVGDGMAGKVRRGTWQGPPINRKVHIKKCWQQWEREFPLSSSTRPPANLHVTLFLSRPSFFIKLCCIPRWNSRHRLLCHLSQNFWLIAFFIWKTIHMIALKQGLLLFLFSPHTPLQSKTPLLNWVCWSEARISIVDI